MNKNYNNTVMIQMCQSPLIFEMNYALNGKCDEKKKILTIIILIIHV